MRLPELDDQHEAGQRQREREPDTSAHALAVNEACPECDENRTDELDHERNPDLDTMDREEVRPLHEREAADTEREEERELRAP